MQEITMTQEDYDLLQRTKKTLKERQGRMKATIEKQFAGMSIQERSAEMRRRRVMGLKIKK